MNDINLILNVFEDSLNSLQLGLRKNLKLQSYFPSEKISDILNTKLIIDGVNEKGIYDHQWLQRKFFISESLLELFQNFWLKNATPDSVKHQMCQLFFLHELYHLSQNIDSNTYHYSRNTKTIISQFDYKADAIAVKMLFLIETSSKPWHIHLAEILKAHILCGEVFSYADDNRQDYISGERLRRQLTWHLQYARAVSFLPESTFDKFDIEYPLTVELLKIEYVDRRVNLLNNNQVSPDDLKSVELQITWQGARKRHAMTTPYFSENLVKGLFHYQFESTIVAFRAFFDENLDLVGRNIPDQISNKELTVDWETLEDLLIELLPDGPNQDEFWSRTGADRSRLRTINLSSGAAWHVAVNLLKNGGAGIKLSKFLQKLSNFFPDNDNVTNFCQSFFKKNSE